MKKEVSFRRALLTAIGLSSSAVLIACGGGGDDVTQVKYRPPPNVMPVPDGGPDLSFGPNGFAPRTGLPTLDEQLKAAVPRGYRQGYYLITYGRIYAFDSAGKPDPSFGRGGYIGPPKNISLRSGAIQPDGKLLVAGESWGQNTVQFYLSRYNKDGKQDLSFGTAGEVIGSYTFDPAYSHQTATAIHVQSDGSILLAGRAGNSNVPTDLGHGALAHISPTGQFLNTLGGNGRILAPVAANLYEMFDSVSLSEVSGNVIVTGEMHTNQNWKCTAETFVAEIGRTDGQAVKNGIFGPNGFRTTGNTNCQLKEHTDVGSAQDDAGSRWVAMSSGLLKFTAGSPSDIDFSFNYSSVLNWINIPGAWNYLMGFAIQPDGKILMAGSGGRHTRLNTDGTPDDQYLTDYQGFTSNSEYVADFQRSEPEGIVEFGRFFDGGVGWEPTIGRRINVSLCANTSPANFSNTSASLTALDPSKIYSSTPYVVDGLARPAPVWVWGGEWSRNGGPFQRAPGMVSNNDSIVVRTFSSDQPQGISKVTLAMGCGVNGRQATLALVTK